MARKPVKPAELKLRIPPGLQQLVEKAARKNERPMNQEVIDRLKQSFAQEMVTSIIDAAAKSTAIEIGKNTNEQFDILNEQLKLILDVLETSPLVASAKKEGSGNG